MKYRPVLPDRNSNVSHEHPLREFAVLLVGAIAVLIAILWLLGLLVDRAVEYIDPQLEAELFQAFTNDETVQTEKEQELQGLIDRLGECVDVGYPVTIVIEESSEANAFAYPGGQVVVLSGLLGAVETENGLAFVLAHELGHFKNRDHLRGMGRSMVLLAVSVLLTGAHSNISSLLTPVYSVELAQYSQHRESEADVIALDALQCHYGHVGGATEFFETLAGSDGKRDWNLTHYFASHPEVQQRIEDLKALAESKGSPVLPVAH